MRLQRYSFSNLTLFCFTLELRLTSYILFYFVCFVYLVLLWSFVCASRYKQYIDDRFAKATVAAVSYLIWSSNVQPSKSVFWTSRVYRTIRANSAYTTLRNTCTITFASTCVMRRNKWIVVTARIYWDVCHSLKCRCNVLKECTSHISFRIDKLLSIHQTLMLS
jgi:hypothetical protein